LQLDGRYSVPHPNIKGETCDDASFIASGECWRTADTPDAAIFSCPVTYAAAAVESAGRADNSDITIKTFWGDRLGLSQAVAFSVYYLKALTSEEAQLIAMTTPTNEMRRKWRKQLLAHCNPHHVAAKKGFVALTFVDQANTSSEFVDINNVLVALVYEDDAHPGYRRSLRLSGYGVRRVPGGVLWGSAKNCRIYKELTLEPQHGARGQRLDLNQRELLALALQLDRRLTRAARYPAAPWPGFRLPQLWAGFRARHTGVLQGVGPEFEQSCHKNCRAANVLFRDSARPIHSLTAYPLDWVSGQLEFATAIFAEVTPCMRRQICRIGNLPEGLIGFQGASAFDFYNSRFHKRASGRRALRRDGRIKAANLQNETRKSRRMRSEGRVA
jgi:hypothetical protein